MKTKIITLIALLIAGGLNMYAQDKKILVAYFSWSGNTQYVAEQIAKQTGGTLFRIEPVKPYPTEYTPCTEVAKKEKEDNARPAIKNKVEDWDSYDTVFIGCPVWWWTAPMRRSFRSVPTPRPTVTKPLPRLWNSRPTPSI